MPWIPAHTRFLGCKGHGTRHSGTELLTGDISMALHAGGSSISWVMCNF